MKKLSLRFAILFCSITVFLFQAQAAISLDQTRIIYNDSDKEVSLRASNLGTYPVLLQSWIDDGDLKSTPEEIDVPFLITPPITRVDAQEAQTFRIRYIGTGHNLNQESVYWLNVLEIPPESDSSKNQLNLAFRTRIKVFLRPEKLKSVDIADLVKNLKWNLVGNELEINNPTPLNISLTQIDLVSGNEKLSIPADMISPYSSRTFQYSSPIKINKSNLKVTLNYLNDFGGLGSILISSN